MDHQGHNEKIPFSPARISDDFFTHSPPKSLNFLNISCFVHFLNTFRYKFKFILCNYQFNDFFSQLNTIFILMNQMIKIDKFPTLLAANQADVRGPLVGRGPSRLRTADLKALHKPNLILHTVSANKSVLCSLLFRVLHIKSIRVTISISILQEFLIVNKSLLMFSVPSTSLADPDLQKRGGQFLPKFLNDLF